MQSKILSSNNAVFKNLSKTIFFLTVINVICTFLLIPFSYILNTLTGASQAEYGHYVVGIRGIITLYFFGTMGYAFLCGVFLTYFMKNEGASDFFNSLPVKRNNIITIVYKVFLSQLGLNILLNGLITWIIGFKYDEVTIEKLLIWALLSVIIALFVFSVTMLLAVFINNITNHVAMTIFVMLSPLIIGTLVYTTHMFLFKGLSQYPTYWMENLTVPVKFLGEIESNSLNPIYYLAVFIASLLITALVYYFYSKRKNEQINNTYANNTVHLILFIVSMFCATLVGGLIGSSMFMDNIYIMVLFYIISFTLIYIALEMMSQRTVRIQVNKKLFLVTLACVLVGLMLTFVSGKMRESYIPDADKVESVKASIENTGDAPSQSLIGNSYIADKQYIESNVKQHLYLLKNAVEDQQNTYPMDIAYKMKDGREIKRTYEVPQQTYHKYQQKIIDENDIAGLSDKLDWKQFNKHKIWIEDLGSGPNTELTKSQKKDFVNAIKKDYSKVPEDSLLDNDASTNFMVNTEYNYTDTNGIVTVSGSEGNYFPIKIYDNNTIKFLSDENIIKAPSNLLSVGKVYEFTDEKYFKDADKHKKHAKKVSMNKVKEAVDSYQADRNGSKLYLIEAEHGSLKIRVK